MSKRVSGRAVLGSVGVAVVMMMMSALPAVSIRTPAAHANPCPDVEVVFARDTGEPPGVGLRGQAFVDALRAQLGRRSVGVYPVTYPASWDWHTGVDGVRDAGAHIASMAENCPETEMVLSGFSQGAAVMGFVTSAAVPAGVDPATAPKPLRPEVADNVAAVVLFGKPNVRAMNLAGMPRVVIGPLYEAKTIQLCIENDPVCSDGLDFAAHDQYIENGTIDRGADFAASRL